MFKRYFKLFLLAGLVSFWPQFSGAAGTSISGSITSPVWTRANSPYIVDGVVNIAKGATLVVEAGAEVRFNPGAKLVVNGELDVLGTVSGPVTMTLNRTSALATNWAGIEFAPSAVSATYEAGKYVRGSIIRNAIIKFGQGIKCTDSSPYLANNQIMNNNIGLEIAGTAGPSGGLAMDASGSTAPAVIPIMVENNIFSDNQTGILINRANSQSYVITPAGYSYVGQKVTTVNLKNNQIKSNTLGLSVAKGDNNLITDNTIEFNSQIGVQLGSATQGNNLEKNIINNNQIGLDSASSEIRILQNSIKNNFDIGVVISQAPAVFAYNNLINNQTANLKNSFRNLGAANNYWGKVTQAGIESSLQTTASSSSLSFPVVYSPYLKSEVDITKVLAPIIDQLDNPTTAAKIRISGVKPVNTKVYFNGSQVVADTVATDWYVLAELQLGENNFPVYYQDLDGNQSQQITVTVIRNSGLPAPVIKTYKTLTSDSNILLSGTKLAGTSLLINNNEVVSGSASTTWQVLWPLNLGNNTLLIMVKDINNQISSPMEININRTKITPTEIIANEKKLSTKVDSKLVTRLSGQILLQVENNSYVWYLSNKDSKRYLITQDNVQVVIKSLALAITEANLNLLPNKSGDKLNKTVVAKYKGKFVLRTEKNGQFAYIDVNGFKHELSADKLVSDLQKLSLGVSNVNLRKIGVGEIK